jgi:hypothetical protein
LDLTQNTSAVQPATGETLNFKEVLVFDSDFMAGSLTNIRAMLCVVGEVESSVQLPSVSPLLGERSPDTANDHVFLRVGNSDYDVSLDGASQSQGPLAGDVNSGNASFNGGTLVSGGNIVLGGETDTGPTGPLLVYTDYDNALNFDSVGAFGTSLSVITAKMRLAEMILLDAVPTTEERQRLEGYLAWKWGQQGSLPADHPYKSSPTLSATTETQTVPAGFYTPETPAYLMNASGLAAAGSIMVASIGSAQPSTQDNATFTYTPGGSLAIDDDELENNNDTGGRFEDGLAFDTPISAESISVDDTDATGIIAREADAMSGIVQSSGANTHSGPNFFLHNGDLYGMHIRIYDGKGAISRNGVPWAKLPQIPLASDRERNDSYGYHYAQVGVSFDGKIVLFCTHHNERIYCMVGETAEDFESGTWTAVGPARDTTYIHAVVGGDGIWLLSRVHDGSARGGSILKITISGTTPSLASEDFLFNESYPGSAARMYPRRIVRWVIAGREYIGWLSITRLTDGVAPPWDAVQGGVLDVTANRWRNFAGTLVGGTSLGTTTTPRFTAAQMAATTHAGGGGMELLGARVGEDNPNRYGVCGYIQPDADFASSQRCSVAFLFSDWENADTNVDDDDVDVRMGVWRWTGSSYDRLVTSDDDDSLSLNDSSSHRLEGDFIEMADGSTQLVISRRTDSVTPAPGTATSTPNNYHDWADGPILEYAMPDLFGVSNASGLETYLGGIARTQRDFTTGKDYLSVRNLKRVQDVPGGYVAMIETSRLHQTHAQGVPVLNDVMARIRTGVSAKRGVIRSVDNRSNRVARV